MAKTRPRPRWRPSQTQEEERREAERVLPGVCAWCLRSIPKRKPVIAVYARFNNSRELNNKAGTMVAVEVANRLVPGRVAEPGSPLALAGWHIGFTLGRVECGAALEAFLDLGIQMRTRRRERVRPHLQCVEVAHSGFTYPDRWLM